MPKYKVKWKDVYLEITKTLLFRGGGGAVGHHTMPMREVVRKIGRYDKAIIEEAIKRLVKKDDLILWPRGYERVTYDSSISINLEHIHDLEKYVKGYPEIYRRIKDIEEEMGY